ncbi:MAG: hypothetical protein ACJASV_002772 [Pseudorhodobacter sp.]|jgi:hypothetical protein
MPKMLDMSLYGNAASFKTADEFGLSQIDLDQRIR